MVGTGPAGTRSTGPQDRDDEASRHLGRRVVLDLRDEVGLHREEVSMTPYWRHELHADDEREGG